VQTASIPQRKSSESEVSPRPLTADRDIAGTLAGLDEGSGGRAEGVVLRTTTR